MNLKYLLVLLIVIFIVFDTSKKIKEAPLLSNDRILAMGDSLTYGYGASSTQSYPSKLSTLTGLDVINAGINGETSSEGLKRLNKVLEDHSIKLMLLCFGGNDIIQRKSMQALKSNLKEMIHIAKAKKIKVLLISVPNVSLFGLSPLSLYEEIADEENIPLASGILSDILGNPSYKSDQIHPNALGYKLMAEKVYICLKDEGFVD